MNSVASPAAGSFGLRERSAVKMREPVTVTALSSDGKKLATVSRSGKVQFWDTQTGALQGAFSFTDSNIKALYFAPDGTMVAIANDDEVQLWKLAHESRAGVFKEPTVVTDVSWSPDGQQLASVSADRTIQLWNVAVRRAICELAGDDVHSAPIWSPDSQYFSLINFHGSVIVFKRDSLIPPDKSNEEWRFGAGTIHFVINNSLTRFTKTLKVSSRQHSATIDYSSLKLHCLYGLCFTSGPYPLATACADGVVRCFGLDGTLGGTLEAHTDAVTFVAACGGGQLLVSGSRDGSFRVWRVADGAPVAELTHRRLDAAHVEVQGNTLVYMDDADADTIHVWEIDADTLLGVTATDAVRYRNAKVVLVGEHGVGKSSLALVMTGGKFVPVESTHGRRVWTFAVADVDMPGGLRESARR